MILSQCLIQKETMVFSVLVSAVSIGIKTLTDREIVNQRSVDKLSHDTDHMEEALKRAKFLILWRGTQQGFPTYESGFKSNLDS